ncbi:MAG TPA: SRPBCC family protein [Acidimicrobiia bacterium]|nr:SRPBCC family protein [Acidimicrobiia bacterium]
MARISRHVDIAAPLDRVWEAAADLATHDRWMADAESIVFLSEQRSGVGTVMQVRTVVGPFRTVDVMEVTEWEEGRTIGVRHTGLVQGVGRFTLAPMAGATRFTWTEELRFPLWLGGPIVAALASPVLGYIWKRNLSGLKRQLED